MHQYNDPSLLEAGGIEMMAEWSLLEGAAAVKGLLRMFVEPPGFVEGAASRLRQRSTGKI